MKAFKAFILQKLLRLEIGTTRYVLTLPRFGIVLKFARLRFDMFQFSFIAYRRSVMKRLKGEKVSEYSASFSSIFSFSRKYAESTHNIRRNLLVGIMHNLSERRVWKTTRRRDNYVPTHFSFFGLVNVQSHVDILSFDSHSFEIMMLQYVEGNELGGHTLKNVRNFTYNTCLCRLQLVDYGEIGMDKFMCENGDIINNDFARVKHHLEKHEHYRVVNAMTDGKRNTPASP